MLRNSQTGQASAPPIAQPSTPVETVVATPGGGNP
jgi:hypothetical protein